MDFTTRLNAIRAARMRELATFLAECIPAAEWDVPADNGDTLLGLASEFGDVAAVVLLLKQGVTVNVVGRAGLSPMQAAVNNGHLAVVRALLATGASIAAPLPGGESALDFALHWGRHRIVTLLLVNGARLHDIARHSGVMVEPWMHAVERGLDQCRRVCVALLSVKRRRPLHLSHVDKFLLRELAWAVWSTRMETEWCPHMWDANGDY